MHFRPLDTTIVVQLSGVLALHIIGSDYLLDLFDDKKIELDLQQVPPNAM